VNWNVYIPPGAASLFVIQSDQNNVFQGTAVFVAQ